MDRNANAAGPEGHDAAVDTSSAANTGVRAIAGILPELRGGGAEEPSQPAAPELLPPGTCVAGKYVLCDVLGTGGLAVVYAAEQLGLKRVVAFKHYPAAAGPAFTERFEREAQLLARVHHENVVSVFDSGRMPDGSRYLVVQRLRGASLAARLFEEGPLPAAEVVVLARQALSALEALSDANILHRDVKPDNLVLDHLPDGSSVLKLVDFGIAQELSDGLTCEDAELMGTPHYMAPEQVRGDRLDARCDLYALGATLYELLTGVTPHRGETLHDVALAALFAPIRPVRELRPDCPEELAQLVMRALAREPGDRFASAHEMRCALESWQVATETDADKSECAEQAARSRAEDTFRIPTLARDSLRPRRVRRAPVALACALALAGVVLPTGAEASALFVHASASVSTLLGHASASAQQWIDLALRSASSVSASGVSAAR